MTPLDYWRGWLATFIIGVPILYGVILASRCVTRIATTTATPASCDDRPCRAAINPSPALSSASASPKFYEGVPFWTADEANTALNENLRVYNALTGRWKTRETPLEATPGMRTAFVSAGLTLGRRASRSTASRSRRRRAKTLNLGRRL